jgi:hypothetical protein
LVQFINQAGPHRYRLHHNVGVAVTIKVAGPSDMLCGVCGADGAGGYYGRAIHQSHLHLATVVAKKCPTSRRY